MKETFFKLLSASLFLFAMGCLSACSDMTDDEGNSALARLEHAPPLVREAQVLLSKSSVRPVDTHSGDHVPPAVTRETRSATAREQFSVDWENYRIVRQYGEDVALFPLERTSQTAYVELTENGRTRKGINKVTSKLIVRRDSITHCVVAVVGTYLCRKDYAKRQKHLLDTLGYDFRGTDFSGYFIASRPDGTMLAGTRYVKGEEHFSFEANALLPEERDTLDLDDELHLFLDLKPATVETRATTVDDVEDVSNFRCSFCNQLYMNCPCVSITVCRYCRKRKSECTCTNNPTDNFCTVCNSEVLNGRCNCCVVCKNYPCRCDSGNNGSEDTGNSGNQGGTSGGVSSSGGGSTFGGGSNWGGNQQPSHMTTVEKLKSAAISSVYAMMVKYGTTMAVCNFGVQYAFKEIFGSSSLPPGMSGRANDMVRAWADNRSYWHPISLEETQEYANNGYFVVAGYENPNPNKSGHVVVIMPGTTVPSNSWKCNVPHTMDTGSGRRGSNIPLSSGFGKNIKDSVKFYYYEQR